MVATTGVARIISVPHVGQVMFYFTGRFVGAPAFAPATAESLEVRLFAREDIPWGDLSFPSITATLKAVFAGDLGGHETIAKAPRL